MAKFYYLTVLLLVAAVSADDSDESREDESNRVQIGIGCQNRDLRLACRNKNEIMTIIYANYGRIGRPYCPAVGQNNRDVCISDNSSDIVSQRCNGTTACTIPVTNSVFGDPCNGITKYLIVAYSCSKFVRACENGSTTIRCPRNQGIIITSANYGRTNASPCSPAPASSNLNRNCVSSNATQIASQICDLRNSCTLTADSSTYGDSCPQTYKYLEATYYCIRMI